MDESVSMNVVTDMLWTPLAASLLATGELRLCLAKVSKPQTRMRYASGGCGMPQSASVPRL